MPMDIQGLKEPLGYIFPWTAKHHQLLFPGHALVPFHACLLRAAPSAALPYPLTLVRVYDSVSLGAFPLRATKE